MLVKEPIMSISGTATRVTRPPGQSDGFPAGTPAGNGTRRDERTAEVAR